MVYEVTFSDLPSQSEPTMVYPALQVQVKEPIELLHVENAGHLRMAALHSSISATKAIYHNTTVNYDLFIFTYNKVNI